VIATGSLRLETVHRILSAGRDIPVSETFLVVADYVGAAQAELLRKEGMEFIDSAGNVFITIGGLYLFVTGKKPRRGAVKEHVTRQMTRNGLKLVFAFLTDVHRQGDTSQTLLNRPFREIAVAAGVSLGSVGPLMAEIRVRDYIAEDPEGRRMLVDRQRLAETWVIGYTELLRPKLLRQRYRAGRPQNWVNLDLARKDVFWGGEVAAAKMTGYLKPQVVTLYAAKDIRELILAWDLRVDAEGDVEVLETFWGDLPGSLVEDCVHPLLVYADLVASNEDRNIETSGRLYDTVLRHSLESA